MGDGVGVGMGVGVGVGLGVEARGSKPTAALASAMVVPHACAAAVKSVGVSRHASSPTANHRAGLFAQALSVNSHSAPTATHDASSAFSKHSVKYREWYFCAASGASSIYRACSNAWAVGAQKPDETCHVHSALAPHALSSYDRT